MKEEISHLKCHFHILVAALAFAKCIKSSHIFFGQFPDNTYLRVQIAGCEKMLNNLNQTNVDILKEITPESKFIM